MEHRKCTNLGGVLGLGHGSMRHVWSAGNVLVSVEFWDQDMLHVSSTGNVLVCVEF